MGLILGLCAPLVARRRAVLMSPMSFLVRPARWIHMLATNGPCLSAAPNFAFELSVRRTSDDDMAGLDLGNVQRIVSGSERIHVATVKRFTERFAPYNLSATAIRPSYGLAEATLYVAAPEPGTALKTVRFDYEQLTAGRAKPCGTDGTLGTELIGYGAPDPTSVRIVDPETMVREPRGDRRRDLGARRPRGDGILAQAGTNRARLRRQAGRSRARSRRRDRGCGPAIWASSPTANCSSWAASRTC